MSFLDALGRQGAGAASSSSEGHDATADNAFAAESRTVASAIFQMTTCATCSLAIAALPKFVRISQLIYV